MRLNTQQNEIVEFPLEDSILVMAGAGSGKTTVIARRALRLAKLLGDDTHLQMLTFSNKAASEMKQRAKRINSILPANILFDTFHSFGLKLIKTDPQGFGLTSDFTLLNDTDVKRSMRALARDAGLAKNLDSADKKRLNPMNWLSTWSLKRQAGFDVRNHDKNRAELCSALQAAHKLSADETLMAWTTLVGYEETKQKTNSLDFDDLLFLPLLRVARDPQFATEIRKGLGAIITDEAQDTNRIQYELVARIAKDHCAVTMVGDDDQSIYGWRGADVSNLRRFQRQFNAHDLRLEQNYRSTKSIVNVANELIQFNEGRLDKTPFSDGDLGTDPDMYSFNDSWEMAREIADGVRRRLQEGVPATEIAILYRTNRMAILLEPALRKAGIPYHVVGGMSLFDRAEVVAITNAIRLARNPLDSHAFKSLVPYIDRFGESSADSVCDWLENTLGADLYQLPTELPGVPSSRMSALKSFMGDLQSEALMCASAKDFILWAVNGPMALLEREKDDQLRERREQTLDLLSQNIDDELLERVSAGEKITWRDIAVEIALRDSGQTQGGSGQITLSTIHRSKGLEWEHVLLVGLSEGLMPLDARSDVSDEDAGYCHIEEERRLGYVGITRAKKMCEFYHANKYAFPGAPDDKTYKPSRFLAEMGYSLDIKASTSNKADFEFNEPVLSQVTNVFKHAMGLR
ncbi:ATP-dependent helicase [Pseudomonas sp. UMAB-40]|uniref:ATP-dependent helicase n=1 Tax=Pseudomonas sp. UMAB-40 TaxID=1365407 RepID=UPI001C593B45|nr:ATP-dependent helicase [Pseudomonas sp. UMAB-40]